MTLGEIENLGSELDLFEPHPVPESLLRFGLAPALPVATLPSSGRTSLIWGWHLVRRATITELDYLETREIAVSSDLEALDLALELEGRRAEYSLAEQDRILAYVDSTVLASAGKGDVTIADISLRVRGDGALADQVARYRLLTDEGRELVDDKFVPLKTAERLSQPVIRFIRDAYQDLLDLSFSSRRQFLELASELLAGLAKDDDPPEHFGAIRSAVKSRDPLEAVRRLRYPTLSEMEDKFASLAREVVGSTGVRVEPPRHFEGDEIHVGFSFRDREELERRLTALNLLAKRCDEFLEIL